MKNSLYNILGLKRKASIEEIRGALREKSKEIMSCKISMPEKMGKLNPVLDAFNILSDPIKKKAYDLELEKALKKQTSNKKETFNIKSNIALIEPFLKMLGYKIKILNNSIAICDLNDNIIDFMSVIEKTEYGIGALSQIGDTKIMYIGVVTLSELSSRQKYNNQIVVKQGTKAIIIEIEGVINSNRKPNVKILITDPSKKYTFNSLFVSLDTFVVEIDNQIPIDSELLIGINRSFYYNSISKNIFKPDVYKYVEYDGEKANSIIFRDSLEEEPNGKILDISSYVNSECNELAISKVKDDETSLVARQIISYGRVKNLINYVANNMEKNLPGIKNYLTAQFNLFKEISDTINVESSYENLYLEQVLNNFPLSHCDFQSEKKPVLNRQYKIRRRKY